MGAVSVLRKNWGKGKGRGKGEGRVWMGREGKEDNDEKRGGGGGDVLYLFI